ncbi:hypothetical protein [Gymnodinialimonas sp. 57CJ19]|uniref:hypothetical protein n=1 Tax=Gymnodinialimonas sp. 57CJ19 TaxID=3138498 RepID=UPI0031343EC9
MVDDFLHFGFGKIVEHVDTLRIEVCFRSHIGALRESSIAIAATPHPALLVTPGQVFPNLAKDLSPLDMGTKDGIAGGGAGGIVKVHNGIPLQEGEVMHSTWDLVVPTTNGTFQPFA